jgi:hypothetical protein
VADDVIPSLDQTDEVFGIHRLIGMIRRECLDQIVVLGDWLLQYDVKAPVIGPGCTEFLARFTGSDVSHALVGGTSLIGPDLGFRHVQRFLFGLPQHTKNLFQLGAHRQIQRLACG